MNEYEMLKNFGPTIANVAGVVVVVMLFLRFLGNHFSSLSDAMRNVAVALEGLKTIILDHFKDGH
jgi:hypothetical protein